MRYTFDRTKNKDWTYRVGYTYNSDKYKWSDKAPSEEQPYTYDSWYTNLNLDISDFSDLELGYSNRISVSGFDSDYSNYNYQNQYPYNYVYLKYHSSF